MKKQYIRSVNRTLVCSARQKKEILRDLEEIFTSAADHGETEAEVIERLGSPENYAMAAEEGMGVNRKTVSAACDPDAGPVFAVQKRAPLLVSRANERRHHRRCGRSHLHSHQHIAHKSADRAAAAGAVHSVRRRCVVCAGVVPAKEIVTVSPTVAGVQKPSPFAGKVARSDG